MHFWEPIWRPPYEASSLLLQVTAGCTHHACKFCTLNEDLPFKFRLSPEHEIEADLQELQLAGTDPMAKLMARLNDGSGQPVKLGRIFLTGANPFVLSFGRLKRIAALVRQYLPKIRSIGCFARVTDIAGKSDNELRKLHRLGFDDLTIGVESGDDDALSFTNKGYTATDIIVQTKRLDEAGISYRFFYLAGIAGHDNGTLAAERSAQIFNQTHPKMIGSSMLTIFRSSALFKEIQSGRWEEAGEIEKLEEVRMLIQALDIPTEFAALGASNMYIFEGRLPEEQARLISGIDRIIRNADEQALKDYRARLQHL